VLADKLVPQGVLDLIPSKTELVIAKNFPGNADNSQEEMMCLAVQGAGKGLCVVPVCRFPFESLSRHELIPTMKLKQGDPSIYGRSSEEVRFLRSSPSSSQVSPPPWPGRRSVASRDIAESVVVCTSVGRGGRGLQMPEYEIGGTLVILLGIARVKG